VAVFSSKRAISLKHGNVEPRMLSITSKKLHTHFQFVLNSATLDDLEWPLYTLLDNVRVFWSPPQKFDRISGKNVTIDCSYRQYKDYVDIHCFFLEDVCVRRQ